MIEVNIPLGNFRFQFIKDDPGVLRYVSDQSVCDKCDSHAVTGQVVGSDLLIFQKHTHKTVLSQREQLFLQVGREKADAIGTMTEYANKLFTMPKTTLATGSRIVQF